MESGLEGMAQVIYRTIAFLPTTSEGDHISLPTTQLSLHALKNDFKIILAQFPMSNGKSQIFIQLLSLPDIQEITDILSNKSRFGSRTKYTRPVQTDCKIRGENSSRMSFTTRIDLSEVLENKT